MVDRFLKELAIFIMMKHKYIT